MPLDCNEEEGAFCYTISGALDISIVSALETHHQLRKHDKRPVILDLSAVKMADINGMAIVLDLCRTLSCVLYEKKLSIRCTKPCMREMLIFCQFPLLCPVSG
jgi:ABC-type transporter Mla MlaB component